MHIPPEWLPVVQITLPVVGAILAAAWLQNKRIDDLIARVTTIEGHLYNLVARVSAIEIRLGGIEDRLTRLEERPPLVHR